MEYFNAWHRPKWKRVVGFVGRIFYECDYFALLLATISVLADYAWTVFVDHFNNVNRFSPQTKFVDSQATGYLTDRTDPTSTITTSLKHASWQPDVYEGYHKRIQLLKQESLNDLSNILLQGSKQATPTGEWHDLKKLHDKIDGILHTWHIFTMSGL